MKIEIKELKLIKDIENAFKYDLERPKDAVTLHQATARDMGLSKSQELEARKFDTDKHWREIPDKYMKEVPSPWSFLNKKGLRYYLPAYLRFCIKFIHTEESSVQHALSMIIRSLYPFGSSEWSVKEMIKSLNLNKTQCKIIFKFLKNFEGEYQLKDTNWNSALNDWKKFSE